jgi:hypothetical protein
MPKSFFMKVFLGILLCFPVFCWTQTPAHAGFNDKTEEEKPEKKGDQALDAAKASKNLEGPVDHEDLDGLAAYKLVNPGYALGLRASFTQVPGNNALGSSEQFYYDRFLPWQKYGAITYGGHIGTLPIRVPNSSVPYPYYANASVGVGLHYQLVYFHTQWVVPVIGMEWDYYRIKSSTNNTNQATGGNFGVSGGIMINLSMIDQITSRDAYETIGLVRCYLTAEVRTANFNNSTFHLSGNFWYAGLRMEFE